MGFPRPSPSPEATREAGRLLTRAIEPAGLVLVLTGPLGAGKTVFAKGLAAGLGIDPAAVASPTFAICSEYTAPDGRRFAHVDCYRIGSGPELEDAGFVDLLAPGAIVAIEWGERFRDILPGDRLEVTLSRPPAPARVASEAFVADRRLDAVASGPVAARVLARWEQLLDAARVGGD